MPLFLSKTVRPIWWICLGAILILLLNVIRRLPEMPELFASGDGAAAAGARLAGRAVLV